MRRSASRVLVVGVSIAGFLATASAGCQRRVPGAHSSPLPQDLRQPLHVRLGYPADAKLLILNADDLGLSHSENAASLAALDRHLITSATAMVPCPWFAEVASFARAHPDADIGLHLTLTSEWDSYRWGPVAPTSRVSSLIGPDGYFYRSTAEVVSHAKPAEVEIELRAQIDRARAMGLEPSHLDAHMHALYASADLFRTFLRVAGAYRLPIRVARNDMLFKTAIDQMAPDDPILDYIFSPGADLPASRWTSYYVDLIKSLRPGLTEVFVHLSFDDAESQAIMVNHADWGAAWRQRELDAISSPAVRQALADNDVVLLGWRKIKELLARETRKR